MSAATAAYIGLAVAAAGAGVQHDNQKRAERRQEKANETAEATSQVENAVRRRRAIAQQRVANARNVAQQSDQVGTSSAVQGTNASLATQMGANLGMQNVMIGSQQTQLKYMNQAAAATRRGQNAQAIGQFGQSAGNAYAKYGPQ